MAHVCHHRPLLGVCLGVRLNFRRLERSELAWGLPAAILCDSTADTRYVDNGMHAMGMVQNVAVEQVKDYGE